MTNVCVSRFVYSSDGQPTILNALWLPGEPNDFEDREQCVIVGFLGSMEWNDIDCNGFDNYICQIPLVEEDQIIVDNYAATEVANAEVDCPVGWTKIQDECFYVSQYRLSFMGAIERCAAIKEDAILFEPRTFTIDDGMDIMTLLV